MFFKLKGNHQGANPNLYRKYGQELLMWAGVIWQRKIVFGKFRQQGGAKKQRHCLSPIWPMECTENGYNSHTEPPTVKTFISTDSLESAATFGIRRFSIPSKRTTDSQAWKFVLGKYGLQLITSEDGSTHLQLEPL